MRPEGTGHAAGRTQLDDAGQQAIDRERDQVSGRRIEPSWPKLIEWHDLDSYRGELTGWGMQAVPVDRGQLRSGWTQRQLPGVSVERYSADRAYGSYVLGTSPHRFMLRRRLAMVRSVLLDEAHRHRTVPGRPPSAIRRPESPWRVQHAAATR